MNPPARTRPDPIDYHHFTNSHGYTVCIVDGKAKPYHRIVWERFHGAIPPGYEVHHLDGNRQHNDPANLELLTRSAHRRRHADRYRDAARLRPRDNFGRWCRADRAG